MVTTIKNRISGVVIFSQTTDQNTHRQIVEAAVSKNVSLAWADLKGADLRDANIPGIDLSDADLTDANLRGANVAGAIFERALLNGVHLQSAACDDTNFYLAQCKNIDVSDSTFRRSGFSYVSANGAVMISTDFTDADLSSSDLEDGYAFNATFKNVKLTNASLVKTRFLSCDMRDSVLRGINGNTVNFQCSDLRGAVLDQARLVDANINGVAFIGAYLGSANLRECNLLEIRDDFYALLSAAPDSVETLISCLKVGAISSYLMTETDSYGTLAKILMSNPVSTTARFFRKDVYRYAEMFGLGIAEGDAPEENPFLAILLEWAEIWLKRMKSAFK